MDDFDPVVGLDAMERRWDIKMTLEESIRQSIATSFRILAKIEKQHD